jgi:biotin transport system substrate-specific component
VGVPWLAITTGMNASRALHAGFYPFILGGIVKSAMAGSALAATWLVVHRRMR